MSGFNFFVLTVLALIISTEAETHAQKVKCEIPLVAPKNIAKVINQCQDEIKTALVSEAVHLLKDDYVDQTRLRKKREAFSDDERRIAGCLLQCVYRKMKAVNTSGFPTIEGLVALYTEGVSDRDYILATYQAVHTCLTGAQRKHITTPQSLSENGKTCDIAFHVFDCVSDSIGEYCGQTP